MKKRTKVIIVIILVIVIETIIRYASIVADPVVSTNLTLQSVNGGAVEYAAQRAYNFTSARFVLSVLYFFMGLYVINLVLTPCKNKTK